MTLVIQPDAYQEDDLDLPLRGQETPSFLNPLFWVMLATAGSAFNALRFELAGMAFHPYIFFLGLLVFRAVSRLHQFPARIGRPGMIFLLLYITSLIQGTSFLIQLSKISLMAITLVIIAVSVRSHDDFFAGALGLGIGIGVLCIRGMAQGPGSFGSINPIDGVQKNAFSLYYLPALTLCLYLLFSGQLTLQRRLILAALVTLIFAAIALSKNRSGWLTSGLLLLLLFSTNQHRFRLAAFLAIASILAYLVASFVTSEADTVYERDAINSAQSDQLRLELILNALVIGLQHPLLGVSPTKLGYSLSTLLQVNEKSIDCHNLTGYLIGGSGFLTFGTFCFFVLAMLRPPRAFQTAGVDPIAKRSTRILAIMTAIMIVRSQFQEDVLFSATFTAGLGLCIGLCICTGVYAPSAGADLDSQTETALPPT
jgi:O-Antigen ligase